jgi:hypothetical protein
MELFPVEVESHSGYKSDEYPKCFYWNLVKYDIQEIIDRWYQRENTPEWPVSDYFRIMSTSGEQFLLKHDLERDEWFLCRKS